ncbi:hypothetical protein BDP27DRAFT_823001 [Rhodocollybia butyracea]|uniref:Transmembrane protein n=1 Tax=Rhodocollybia butyracea TaxID=206335 RepID=A0A9P5PMA0_9AGAR|nr:hypothetical protein BDP27DRAFT_823001 [Rhodocollybia butyracea]
MMLAKHKATARLGDNMQTYADPFIHHSKDHIRFRPRPRSVMFPVSDFNFICCGMATFAATIGYVYTKRRRIDQSRGTKSAITWNRQPCTMKDLTKFLSLHWIDRGTLVRLLSPHCRIYYDIRRLGSSGWTLT